MNPQIGLLLINVGTPDSPKVHDVRRYLSEFLNDPRVIDIPWLFRKLLVNLIIVPFRSPKSAKIYEQMWTEDGSPLLIHSNNFKSAIQKELGSEFQVGIAMRYQRPSIWQGLEMLRKSNPRKIIIIPMYPQYASSSTGTCFEEVKRIVSKWQVIPEMVYVNQFYGLDGYIRAFVRRGKQLDPESFDHILFSFHGLPVRQLDKAHGSGTCADYSCKQGITQENRFCYRATCYETARRIAAGLHIPEDRYTVSFQSRLDRDWMEPFSDKVIEKMGKDGVKNLLVFSPAFVADCLETIVEIGIEYQEIFEKSGGGKIHLVESLNDDPFWVRTMADYIRSK